MNFEGLLAECLQLQNPTSSFLYILDAVIPEQGSSAAWRVCSSRLPCAGNGMSPGAGLGLRQIAIEVWGLGD